MQLLTVLKTSGSSSWRTRKDPKEGTVHPTEVGALDAHVDVQQEFEGTVKHRSRRRPPLATPAGGARNAVRR